MIKISEIIRRGFTLKILWDIFMVLAVIVNLHLIVFDLTYLSFRPYYLENLPQVTKFYDPFLGIEPHHTTGKYLSLVNDYNEAINHIEKEGNKTKALELSDELIQISIKMVEENSFEKSGLTGNLQRIKQVAKNNYRFENKIPEEKDVSSKDAFRWFWTYDSQTAINHVQIFNDEIKDLMKVNYYRSFGLNGKYKDEFYKLDLPFFVLFLLEFLVQWYLSLKRKEYVAWFLYPMYHFYDVLGLMPFPQLRFFRLFRLASMYIFLKKTRLTHIGDDIITRTIRYYSNIIKEELSDLVTIRILSEMQEEIKSGASVTLITNAIESRREDIKKLIKINIKKSVTNSKANEAMRKLLAEALVKSTANASSLNMVPAFLKENITKDIGLSIFDAMNEVLSTKLTGEEGEENINKLVDGIIDDIVIGAKDSEVNALNEAMTIEVIENMKKAVSVKKWVKAKL
jgi:hypothetical protein